MSEVIVDTSAWIESFRPQGDPELKEEVRQLILQGKILLPGIIRAEILRGAKSEEEYRELSELLGSLTYLPVEDSFWEELAKFSFDLLRAGLTIPLTDAYVALLAIKNRVPLLHRDRRFDLIAQRTSLEILRRTE